MNIEGIKKVLIFLASSKNSAQSDMNTAAHDIARDINSKSKKSESQRTENHLKYKVASAKVDAYNLSICWLEDAIDKCEKAVS